MRIPATHWGENWQKDSRFSKRATEALILKACRLDTKLDTAFTCNELKVNAGPHRKAGENGGGDARWHITVRQGNSSGWHIILDRTCRVPVAVEKRPPALRR